MVEFHDTDMAGIMHFASFFHYMESAEHELIRSLGLSVHSTLDGAVISFPRVSVACDFVSPALCEQVLDITVSVARIGNKSVTYQFEFHHESRLVATGRITCVCCRVQPGTMPVSIVLPEDVAEKLRCYAA
jgi:4-hydroxybenzoyl-CoA thioesterase/acyl-CoA thioester hydrolase